jgi:hypothetical protein
MSWMSGSSSTSRTFQGANLGEAEDKKDIGASSAKWLKNAMLKALIDRGGPGVAKPRADAGHTFSIVVRPTNINNRQ